MTEDSYPFELHRRRTTPPARDQHGAPFWRERLVTTTESRARISSQFVRALEYAHASREVFPDFLNGLLDNKWHVDGEGFRELLINQLDRAVMRHKTSPDYVPGKLSHPLQRYIDERSANRNYSNGQRYLSHPTIPTDALIDKWREGILDPDGSQLTLFSEAFELGPKHEQMLCKMVRGYRLSLPVLMRSIHEGNSGQTCKLLARATGLSDERLAELLDIPYATLKDWTDPRRDSHRVMDAQAAKRFAQFTTQCLDDCHDDQRHWLLPSVHKDITGLLIGKNLRAMPDSPEEASARFQLLLEESFHEGKNFHGFITGLLNKWDAQPTALNFLNPSDEQGSDEPLSKYTFYSWANGSEIPHAITMRKLVSGASLSYEQEMMLWKMSTGKAITIEDIKANLAEGHSGKLLTHLIEASGIPNSRLTEITGANDSMIHNWKHPESPKKIGSIMQARALTELLTKHLHWPEHTQDSEQTELLKTQMVDLLAGKQFATPLYDMAIEAVDQDKPSGHLLHLLAQRMELGHSDIADAVGVTPTVLSQLKMGKRPCSEALAKKLITLAGGDPTSPDMTDLVDILTQSASPEDMLRRAKSGHASIGDVIAETRKRRQLTRKDVQEMGIGKNLLETLERGERHPPIDEKDAHTLCDIIGFSGTDRIHFRQLATAQELTHLQHIIRDSSNLVYDEHETLKQLCKHIGLSTEAIAEHTGTDAAAIKDYCNRQSAIFPFTEDEFDQLLALCGSIKPQERNALSHIFAPDAIRLLNLASHGKQSREEAFTKLMALADITPTMLQQQLDIPPITSRTPSLLMADPELPNILAIMSARLHLRTGEQDWLSRVFDENAPKGEAEFLQYMEQYRLQTISSVVSASVDYALQWHRLLHENKAFIAKWEEYEQAAPAGKTKHAISALRNWLADNDNQLVMDNLELYELGRIAAKHLSKQSAPDHLAQTDTSDQQWRGEIFDAVNKCLFQKLCRCREKLGLGEGVETIARNTQQAREQKDLLLADPEGRNIISAIQAFNQGNIARLCARIRYLPKYKNLDDAALFSDIWLGPKFGDEGSTSRPGMLEVFMKWRPAMARFSTYVDKPARWLAFDIARNEMNQHEISGLQDKGRNHDDSRGIDMALLDGVASERYTNSLHDNYDKDKVELLLHKVELAVSMLPTREKAIIQAVFHGISEGSTVSAKSLMPVATGSHSRNVSRQRVAQLRDSAYEKFMEAWETVAEPGDEIPVGLKAFLDNMKGSTSRTFER